MKLKNHLGSAIAAALIAFSTTAAHAAEPAAAAPSARDFSVVLLGTGTPNPNAERFGGAVLVQAGGQNLVFDAGRGVTIRLWQLGLPLSSVDHVFLTHYHFDHTNGLVDLWLTGWVSTAYGGRTTPFRITGPKGLGNLTRGLEAAYADDLAVRVADEGLPLSGVKFDVTEFDEAGGVVYEQGGVKVTAFPNEHGEKIHPSVGYRIDYGGRSVLISGDTRPSPGVLKYGKGVDLLIHEVAAARPGLLEENPKMQPIMDHHSTPEQAGRIFAETRPKLAAYTHYVLPATKKYPPMSVNDIKQATQTVYDGPLAMGEDLMRFDIADTVSVVPWKPASR